MLDLSPDALVLVNQEGHIVRTNEQAAALFGYPEQVFLEFPLERLLPLRFRQIHTTHRTRYFATPRTRPMGVGLPLFGLRKDGSEFPVDISLQPLLLDGKIHALAVVRDETAKRVAERERAAQAQRVAERERAAQAQQLRLLTDLVDLSSDAILLRDPISRIIFWNSGAQKLYGWSSHEALGRITHTLFKTSFPQGKATLDAHLEQRGRWEGVLTHTRRNGSTVLVESHQALVRDEAGQPLTILEINREINESTERARRELIAQATHNSNDAPASQETVRLELLKLLEVLPCGAYLVSGTDARLLYANRAAHQIWGAEWHAKQPLREFLLANGITILDMQGHLLAPDQSATMNAIHTGATVLHRQETIRRPDGTLLPILVHVVNLPQLPQLPRLQHIPLPIRHTDERVSAEAPEATEVPEVPEAPEDSVALVIYEDVTTLKNETDYSKDEFIGIAAHELRSPLTVLSGYVQLLQRRFGQGEREDDTSQLDARQQDALTKIQQATDRLTTLTEDLLNVTRLQAGQMAVHPSPTNVVPLTQQIASTLQQTTERHQIEVCTTQDAVIALADASRLEQVMTNLIGNAIKYSPQGGPVSVSITITEDAQRQQARLTVQDQGIGIPRQQHGQIFGRFIRADNARARDIQGTGLGLYLCQELIGRMGGQLWFESEENIGSTFFVTLPLAHEP
jgi:PAS domain S-box